MDYRLELVPIPVSDVDRAKAFYAEKVGFDVDLDVSAETDNRVSDERRVVQLTPPGSACSIALFRDRDLGHAAGLRPGPTLGRFGHRGGACGAR
jgi:catechol 2,3-dioxygenase-like lactoylglutathione lyase family enzyme